MDRDRALTHIDGLLETIDRYLTAAYGGPVYPRDADSIAAELQALNDEIRTELVTSRAIATEIAPALSARLAERPQPLDHGWAVARTALIELRARITKQQEIAEIVGPGGPKLAASALHPTIWSAASHLWDDGYHRQAVQTASSALEGVMQSRLGRDDVAGQSLAQAFSTTDPTAEWPRFRIQGISSTSQTWTSAHEGAAALTRGAFAYVRNLASHPGGPNADDVESLEQMAVLSTVARIIDRCDVVRAEA